MEVRLLVTRGPSRGKSKTLHDGDVILVGRSPRCHLVIGGDEHCSRAHLLVVVHPPSCTLRDLGSLNGTFVNGQRVQVATLNHGDRIEIGNSEITVEFVQVGAAPSPAQPRRDVQPAQQGTSLPPVQLPEHEEGEPEGGIEQLRFVESERGGEAEGLRFVETDEEEFEESEEAGVVRCARCGREQTQVAVQVPALEGRAVFVCQECREQMRQHGEQIPGYRIRRHLSRGGQGDIWEAESLSTGERVAIKTLIPDIATSRRAVRRFTREMRIAQQLQHPNIVRCIDAGEYHGLFYIVMEFVEGVDAETLRRQSGGTLPIGDVITIGLQTLDALIYAHGQGVVHRDIKPSNIMVVGRSPNLRVKVTDFGYARARAMSVVTRPGDVFGTIPFMPPEQIIDAHNVDERGDIFSLGASLYHLLTGQFVFDFQPGVKDFYLTILEDPVIPIRHRRRDIPSALAQVIDRAIDKRVDRRFRSAQEMKQALEALR
ncbi:MAG: serine/threonine-protein kinase [Armatimonadetes bacterium]|nr:serine/threonine-protein kinase [Armatimonadota bacterium]